MARQSPGVVTLLTAPTRARPTQGAIAVATYVALAAALVAVGVFLAVGRLSDAVRPTEAAQLNEPVAIPGGALRVDEVIPEHMAPMYAGKFSNVGMSMSAMGMDMAPEGYRRFTVQATLMAEGGAGIRYQPEDFQIAGLGLEPSPPIRHFLGGGGLPAGSAVLVSLTFQAPEAVEQLELRFRDGGRPVLIVLPPADGSHDGHGHEAPADDGHDGHDHGADPRP